MYSVTSHLWGPQRTTARTGSTHMPRRPGGPFDPTATSLGSLLRSDIRDTHGDLIHPRVGSNFPPPSEIAAADGALVPMLNETRKERESMVRDEADRAAQRYLDERHKGRPPSPSSIWGAARLVRHRRPPDSHPS